MAPNLFRGFMLKNIMLEIIIIAVSALIISMVYFARYKSTTHQTFLFPSKFLTKADDIIFSGVKFVFKIYTLFITNFVAFIKTIPHGIVHFVHKISNASAGYTHTLIEKIKKIEQK